MSVTQLPNDITGLIKLLDATFPLRNYPVGTDLSSIHRELGKRDVVEFLKSLHQEHVGRLSDGD